jgi:ribosomal protein L32
MKNRLKMVQCKNCRFFYKPYQLNYEGICEKDGEFTRDHRVCNKLPSDEDRRNAKLKKG